MRKPNLLLAGAVAAALALPGAALPADQPAPPKDQPAPAKPAIPAVSDVLEAWGIALNGYLDVSFSHLSGSGAFTSSVPDRVFDARHDEFNLHQAAITIARQPKEGFGGLVNVTAGVDADVIAPFDQNDFTRPGGASTSKFDLTQAYLQYASPAIAALGGSTITAIGGKFVTLAGAEVINSTANTNFSRSILFGFAIPFTHTGVRVSIAPNDMVTLIAGVNNGWDTLKDTNSNKTGEFGISYTPIKAFSLTAQGYVGRERVGGLVSTGPQGRRSLADVVATFNATDQLSFIVNYDYGRQENAASATPNSASAAKWQGAAGYVNYQFTDKWRASVRGEWFDDKDGYRTGVIQKWKEATLTLAYLPDKNVELRVEGRQDWSNVASFLDSGGVKASKNQNSVGLQAMYKF